MTLRVTHGRHCICSACARQDWTEEQLGSCGMHGAGCPSAYRPLGMPGEVVSSSEEDRDWMVVRRSDATPGGYSAVRTGLTEQQARLEATRYALPPYEAMAGREFVDRMVKALERPWQPRRPERGEAA